MSEFKYLGCVLHESDTDEADCLRKVASGRKVTGVIRSVVKARSLELECARVLPDSLLVPVLTLGSATILWKEEQSSRIGVLKMDNLRGL